MIMTRTAFSLTVAEGGEIKKDTLLRFFTQILELAEKLEERLRPSLGEDQTIQWTANFCCPIDQPWMECVPSPLMLCQVSIGNPETKPFEVLHPGRGPMIFDDSCNPVFDLDRITEEAAQSLFQ